MNNGHNRVPHFDIRIILYRTVKRLALIILLALIIKYAFCDTVLIGTDQMTPAIQDGDRVLLSKIKYASPFKVFFSPRHKDLIVFNHPHFKNKAGCLRIAGKPGDVVSIQNGTLSIINRPEISFNQKAVNEETLPSEYSPRDTMRLFRIPQTGDIINMDTLCIRDYIFLFLMIKQENPQNIYTLQPLLYIDDSLTNDYIIKDFSLYTGKFSAIPDTFYADWFFWDRLEAYLSSANSDSNIDLTFSLLENQSPIKQYTIKKDFYFLLSDNWRMGFDSRYFGPILETAIKGKVVGILWSFTPLKSGTRALRIRRIFKII